MILEGNKPAAENTGKRAGRRFADLAERHARWMECGPAFERGDLERLEAFRPRVSVMALSVYLVLGAMGAR